METFDIPSLLDEVATTAQPLVAANANKLQLQLDGELGTMQADLTKVRQILLNLLGNAAKFTTGGTITLATSREQFDGQAWVHFRVGVHLDRAPPSDRLRARPPVLPLGAICGIVGVRTTGYKVISRHVDSAASGGSLASAQSIEQEQGGSPCAESVSFSPF